MGLGIFLLLLLVVVAATFSAVGFFAALLSVTAFFRSTAFRDRTLRFKHPMFQELLLARTEHVEPVWIEIGLQGRELEQIFQVTGGYQQIAHIFRGVVHLRRKQLITKKR